MKDLTREKALELHRQMWSDMQKDLGDNPPRTIRGDYKRYWLRKHFPELAAIDDYEIIRNNCFLCEYADDNYGDCKCLIDWPCGRCEDGDEYEDERNWSYMPISKLLALPERKMEGIMKYIVTTTENGFIEELEVYGKTYRKEWVETDCGFSTNDGEFNEQLAEDGIEDEQLLDEIWDRIDCIDVGSDMYKIEKELM